MPLARPTWGINHVIAYGQSLSTGWEGWPALSRYARHDNLVFGHSVRPREENAPRFQPVGDAGLHPLVATVQSVRDGTLLTTEQVAALPQGDVSMGETVLEGALHQWRARMLEDGARPGTHRLLASACGVAGRNLEALMKGAAPELFNRLRECVQQARAAVHAGGHSYGLTAVLFLQGEHNNWGLSGGASDEAGYFALVRRFHADVIADIAAAQAEQPALFLYQTGGAYAADAMGVPMAQLRMALEVPGVFMAAPVYPVTEKGGHVDANGYRWLGAQFGKVMHQVLDLGRAWRPLHPIAATLDGQTIRLGFHVPVPPLRFGAPFRGRLPIRFPDEGFFVADDAGEIPLAAATITAPDTVTLVLARPAGSGLFVRYAGRTRHSGRGCLHDSDPARAEDVYEYDAHTGHAPQADIRALAGRPYPLMNWCVAFRLAVAPPV
jgi:hypothetical protein